MYDDSESLTMEITLVPTSDRVNSQIPFEVTVDFNSPSTAENLNQSEEVKELLDIMKDSSSKFNKEWASIHHQLKYLPHSKMMRLMKAGHLDNCFLKINRLRCPHCIIATQARTHSRYKPSKNHGKFRIRQKYHNVSGACASADSKCLLFEV